MPARLRNDDVGVVLSGGNGLDLFEPSGLCALPAPPVRQGCAGVAKAGAVGKTQEGEVLECRSDLRKTPKS